VTEDASPFRPLDLDDISDRLEREIAFLRIVMPVLDGARVITEDEALRTARGLLRATLGRLEELHNELADWILEPQHRPKADED
jgi:hypothetical protein